MTLQNKLFSDFFIFFFVLCNSVIYDISLYREHKLNFFASILKYIFCKLYSIMRGTKNVINTNIFYQNKNIKLTVILLTIHFILFVQSEDGKKKNLLIINAAYSTSSSTTRACLLYELH